MPKMTGGQALAKSLYREGVRVIFGLPGVQLYHLLDALYDEPGIRFITTRHEQATSFMADGYARAGGGIGAALVVPGPGLLNASSGLNTAYSASSPVLMIAGEIPHGGRRPAGRPRGVRPAQERAAASRHHRHAVGRDGRGGGGRPGRPG